MEVGAAEREREREKVKESARQRELLHELIVLPILAVYAGVCVCVLRFPLPASLTTFDIQQGDKQPKASLLLPSPPLPQLPRSANSGHNYNNSSTLLRYIFQALGEEGEEAACVHSIIISARLALTRLDLQPNNIDSQRHLWIMSPHPGCLLCLTAVFPPLYLSVSHVLSGEHKFQYHV